LPRFAVYKQQALSEEDEEQQQHKKKNNNTDYYLRIEIEEAKTLKSWKILQSIPSETGDQSQAIFYPQDLPSMYLYVEKSLEEGAAATDSDFDGYEVGTISLWDTGRYKIASSSKTTTATITDQIYNGRVELFLDGAKLYGRFLLLRDPLHGNDFDRSSQRDNYSGNDFWHLVKEQENDKIRSVDWTAPKSLLSQMPKTTLTKRQKTDAAIMPQRQQKVLAQPSSTTIATGFPRRIMPMLAIPVDEPFNDEQWVFEFKWDGVRSVLFLNKAKDILEIQSRNGKTITHRYPEIVDQIKKH
jgi:bifunctional non-homologous end joining protein LigD